MNIVLDGMGGDYAPHEMVKGAVQAAELIEDDIYIVGQEVMIQAELNNMGFQGEQIHIVIRETLVELFGEEAGNEIPVLYGGSVNPENAVGLSKMEHIDGLFIGRSAWQADNFNKIIRDVLK